MAAARELDKQPEPVQTNIYDIVVDLDNRWRSIIEQRDIIFTSYVCKELQEPILSHPEIIRRSIDAVLSVSAQNTVSGRIHLHVTAQSGDHDNALMLSAIIADTGSGIMPEGENTDEIAKKSLQAVKDDTHRLGGTVAVNAKSGRGAEVTLIFKARKRAAADLLDEIEMIMSKTPEAFARDSDKKEGLSDPENGDGLQETDGFLDELLSDVAQSQPLPMAETAETESATTETVLELNSNDEVTDILDFTEEDMVSDTVDLDVVADILGKTSEEPETAETPVPQTPAGTTRLLIVEDETSNQEVIKLLLSDADFEILTAFNGHEALQVMRTQAVDVILMDVRMPEMDGIQTIRAIRNCQADYNNTPIIALTADHSAETNADCMAAGADIFLSKPVIAKDLIESVEFVLSDRAADSVRKTA